MIASSPGLM